jgi:hypothetical protein
MPNNNPAGRNQYTKDDAGKTGPKAGGSRGQSGAGQHNGRSHPQSGGSAPDGGQRSGNDEHETSREHGEHGKTR